jgi:hypothetical protein
MAPNTTSLRRMLGGFQGAPGNDLDTALAQVIRQRSAMNVAREIGALPGATPAAAAPAPNTVADVAAASNALVNVVSGAASLFKEGAVEARERSKEDRQRLNEAVADADKKAADARAEEQRRSSEALQIVREMNEAVLRFQKELAVAREEAAAAQHAAELSKLEARLDRMEERYTEREARLNSQLEQAQAEAATLRKRLSEKRSGLDELLDAASMEEPESHPLVRMARLLVPGKQQEIFGPDGKPIDPDLRYRAGMSDVLVQRERDKDRRTDRVLGLVERIYGDAKRVFLGEADDGQPGMQEYADALAGVAEE